MYPGANALRGGDLNWAALAANGVLGSCTSTKGFGCGGAGSASPTGAGSTLCGADTHGLEYRDLNCSNDPLRGLKVVKRCLAGLQNATGDLTGTEGGASSIMGTCVALPLLPGVASHLGIRP